MEVGIRCAKTTAETACGADQRRGGCGKGANPHALVSGVFPPWLGSPGWPGIAMPDTAIEDMSMPDTSIPDMSCRTDGRPNLSRSA